MKKKILFDGIATQTTPKIKFNGGAEYAKLILKNAIEFGYRNFDVVFSRNMINDVEFNKLLKEIEDIKIYYVNSRRELYSLIVENKYDCFYSALPYKYTDYNLNVPFVMVIHGLRAIELPWDEYRHNYFPNAFIRMIAFIVSKSNILVNIIRKVRLISYNKLLNIKYCKIFTVSEHSKYSLMYFFKNIDPQKIEVVYPPFDHKINKNIDMGGEKNYFLVISANRFEKNVYRTIKVFNNLFSKGYLAKKRVVILGYYPFPFLKKLKKNDKFELLPYVVNTELETIFSNAYAFVYPSLNEGYGYPPITAMKYGVPVIASSATSIPEVCDDAAIYFDPKSIFDFANRILQITYNKKLYTRTVERGYKRIEKIFYDQKIQINNMLKKIFE